MPKDDIPPNGGARDRGRAMPSFNTCLVVSPSSSQSVGENCLVSYSRWKCGTFSYNGVLITVIVSDCLRSRSHERLAVYRAVESE